MFVCGTKHASPPPTFTMFVTVVSMGTVFVYTASAGTSNVSVLPSALSVRSAPTAVAVVRQSAAAHQADSVFLVFIVPGV